MIREIKDEVVCGKGEKGNPPLLQAQQVRDYLFGVTNWEKEQRVSLAANVGLSFPDCPSY